MKTRHYKICELNHILMLIQGQHSLDDSDPWSVQTSDNAVGLLAQATACHCAESSIALIGAILPTIRVAQSGVLQMDCRKQVAQGVDGVVVRSLKGRKKEPRHCIEYYMRRALAYNPEC